ncbi:hypothetical protein MGAD_03440 [Mycolicibacterium gadium]|uniref:Lipoprotein LpqS n=1 Tax=Mycolicibacterium gadium TaxID=1794 RepID=A0A7I7WEL0_MYCGU|nr:hypothetical protein MGAD_03440 [Mycolicibacterium gadium]
MGNIVSYKDARSSRRLRQAVALAVVVWVLIIGADALWASPAEPDNHGPHPIATSLADHFAVALDHSHARQAATHTAHDVLALAVSPRTATILATLVLALGVTASWAFDRWAAGQTIRGPPKRAYLFLSGRQLLARLCIARR